MRARRWPTLNQMRDAYAASGLELAKRHPDCRGKVRYGHAVDAERQRLELASSRDEHPMRARRLGVYPCRWCDGFHVGHAPTRGRRRKGQRRRRIH